MPPPVGMDLGSKMVPGLSLTAHGQPKKTGDPNPGRELDRSWMNGDDEPTKESTSPYEWMCIICDKLFTAEEYTTASCRCTSPGCLGKLVAAGPDLWSDLDKPATEGADLKSPADGPASGIWHPSAPMPGRSISTPPSSTPDWVLGQGRKAVLKSGRASSLPSVSEDPADYSWSRGQKGGEALELEDSPWDLQFQNVKKVIEYDLDKTRLSLLETAAYTMSRRQIEQRGYTANLAVGQVLAAAAMSPEQLALFKPAVAQSMKEATGSVPRVVNPSFEVRQVKWSRQAIKVLASHVFRARQGLNANQDWHPDFVHSTPKPIATEVSDDVGGGNTPKAKAYVWPGRQAGIVPPKADVVPPKPAPLPIKANIFNADGSLGQHRGRN